ncbi:MAG: DEAD/DEAH box helicase, partial [Candidatus Thermoplasmatota archaeon]|nr:DEAD/DEAH box helicase [Candidatus Thermoplasmatota archaeon]
MIDLFPYRPRPSQVPVIREVNRISSEGGTLLLDASTGTGKTVAVLAPLLEHALAARHKVLYLVRTHAQGAQVLREVRAIKSNSGVEVLAVTLEGREGRCPLMDGWKVARGATPEELGKLCGDRKRATAEN